MHYTIHTDGGARGNPGPSGAGAVIRDKNGQVVMSISKFLGHKTNNFAEYEAVILAFHALTEIVQKEKRAHTNVSIKMDSELIVKQMQGVYKVKHPVLRERNARLLKYLAMFGKVTFTYVPRAQNKDADLLANKAMDTGS